MPARTGRPSSRHEGTCPGRTRAAVPYPSIPSRVFEGFAAERSPDRASMGFSPEDGAQGKSIRRPFLALGPSCGLTPVSLDRWLPPEDDLPSRDGRKVGGHARVILRHVRFEAGSSKRLGHLFGVVEAQHVVLVGSDVAA